MDIKENVKTIGEYRYFDSCRFCRSKKIKKVIDLGLMPLAGGFIKNHKDIKNEKLYPLELIFCKKCFLLQVNSSINPDTLFKNYFYFSSSINSLLEHFEIVAKKSLKLLGDTKHKFVVEIGANDGGFIRALKSLNINALGVDPATNVVKKAVEFGTPMINSYFTKKLVNEIIKKYGKASAIYSFHSMAHIEDMDEVVLAVKKLLKSDGYLAMEVHYLQDLIDDFQYDMIYHEHQFYYSLLALINYFKKFDMEIFNVERFNIRGGSIMFFVQNIGQRKISKNVYELLKNEHKNKLHKVETYIKFGDKIIKTKKVLLSTLLKLKKQKKSVIGYGASGRGTIIANYVNLTNLLDYVVDDAKEKHGSYLPGTHHKIHPSEKMIRDKINYALLFAWPFYEEVKSRNKNFKGKFIVPLPKVKIV